MGCKPSSPRQIGVADASPVKPEQPKKAHSQGADVRVDTPSRLGRAAETDKDAETGKALSPRPASPVQPTPGEPTPLPGQVPAAEPSGTRKAAGFGGAAAKSQELRAQLYAGDEAAGPPSAPQAAAHEPAAAPAAPAASADGVAPAVVQAAAPAEKMTKAEGGAGEVAVGPAPEPTASAAPSVQPTGAVAPPPSAAPGPDPAPGPRPELPPLQPPPPLQLPPRRLPPASLRPAPPAGRPAGERGEGRAGRAAPRVSLDIPAEAAAAALPAPPLPPSRRPPRRPPAARAGSQAGPAEAADARTIRVFLSSTFKDMEGERGEIFRSAFPRLQRLCAARGLFLVFVDLRWGISEEEAREGRVLLSCLRELDRSQYFVSFLKRRYGWHQAPGEADELIGRTFEVAGEEYPFILRYRDRSITECEVLAAALDRRAPTHKAEGACLFYFASAGLLAGEPPESAHAEARMADLKAAIRAGRPGAVRAEYKEASALANAIHDDLVAMIERDYPPREARSWLEEERLAQEAHASALRKVYVRRRGVHAALDAYAAAAGPELFLLSGPAGYGKSAVLANWVAEYEAAHADEDALAVITHFVGGSDGSANVRSVVRRLHDEARERLHPFAPPALRSLDAISDETDLVRPAPPRPPRPAPPTPHRAIKAHWKATSMAAVSQLKAAPASARENPRARAIRSRVAESRARLAPAALAAWRPRILLVVDGADRIAATHAAARRLAWLPLTAGPELRVVVSTVREGDAYEGAKGRAHTEFALGPMAGDEIEELARSDLRTVGKALDGAQMGALLAAEQCAVPLFLQALLGELKASAVFETLPRLLETCLACRSAEQLYQLTLRRWLGAYPLVAPALGAALCGLAVSRVGLGEDEIQALVGVGGALAAPGPAPAARGPALGGPAPFLEPVSPLLWSECFSAILPSLANRGGLLSLGERPLARAVETVFGLGEAEGRRPHHARLARFFAGQPAGERRALELPHQLLHAGLLAELPAVLLDLDTLHRRRHDIHELAGYWRACSTPDAEIHARYEEALGRWEEEQQAALQAEEAPAGPAPARETRRVHARLVRSSRLAALLQARPPARSRPPGAG
eukprot:tig00000383_g24684.t1